MSSPSYIASEYAIRNTPNPCRGCERRESGCRSDCPDWPKYQQELEQKKEEMLRRIRNENASTQFLHTSARATQAKLSRGKKHG